MANMHPNPLPIVVLLSGRGSNLKTILDAVRHDKLPVVVRAVISNRVDAEGLRYATEASVPTHSLLPTSYANRREFDVALQTLIDRYQPQLVVLAGFMRILTPEFVRYFQGRLINIHPSLLPAYTGLNTHQRALQDNASEHGATVHFVTEGVDEGPIILQGRVAVMSNDSVASLAARVLQIEHRIYPQVLKWFAQGRLKLSQNEVWLDNEPIANTTHS